jgi:signal transduction histidine kinase
MSSRPKDLADPNDLIDIPDSSAALLPTRDAAVAAQSELPVVPTDLSSLHFDIHASIVFQLGDELITDVAQAVLELVKNCYDADATYAAIEINSREANTTANTFFPGALGVIVIEDDGIGMDKATIQRGWLTISNSLKREMKRKKQKTLEKGRTPLGDKGLGRLGVQKLGANVEIFTKPKDEDKEYHVGWSWTSFAGENTLTQIIPRSETLPSSRDRGTTLVISGLSDVHHWQSHESITHFQHKLSEVVSPYRTFSEFIITAAVDGNIIALAEITERIRRLAQLRYRIEFDGSDFRVNGKASIEFIRPKSGEEEIEAFSRLVERDEGDAFFEFLSGLPTASSIKLRRARGAAWFVEFSQTTALAELPGVRVIDSVHKEVANPGPFNAEIDAFDLGARTSAQQGVFDSATEYRDYIKHYHGVRIFRDGFGVRVDKDWLGLSRQWTTAPSYYSLKPTNTMGFVALTAENNSCLVETTDREGFKQTPHYDNFLNLFERFVSFAHDSQEFLRRGWLDFLKANARRDANVAPHESPDQLHRQLEARLADSVKFYEPLDKAVTVVTDAGSIVTRVVASAVATNPTSQEAKELTKLSIELSHRLAEAQTIFNRVRGFLSEVESLRGVSKILHDESLAIRTQLEESYEVVSLGLTAEALSHEINQIADKIAKRTQEILRHLTRNSCSDARLLGYVEFIGSSISGLRKQMAHLAPSLRYVREKRDHVPVKEFLDQISQYFQDRWVDEPLRIDVRQRKEPLVLTINRGKLTQIFDNLILNSEYWLREEIRVGRLHEGIVSIDINSPYVRVSDNGPGIDTLIENTLFDPFVSRKPKQKGRGLGLFIVRQLLDSEGCQIGLSPLRNQQGRLHRFDIDFTGAIDGR